MAKTAKERIEEEIKDVNRSLVYSLNKNGRAFNSGKRQGLTIALAHIENAGQSQHSKLSIPKKIADSIVKLAKYHQKAAAVNGDVFGILDATEWLVNFMSAGRESVMNPELFDYLNQDKSGHIETCIAFMNPLTRPFVEVEE